MPTDKPETSPDHAASSSAPAVGTGIQAETAPTPQEIGLDKLPTGTNAVIVRMDETDHAMVIRLKTMGMHPGRAVRVLRQGSRLVVTCGGTRIGLSATVAEHVYVTPTSG